MKRRVRIPRDFMGSWEVFPNLYIIFVAPPGAARKTTTLNYADDLLDEVPNVHVSSSAMTQQVLMKRIADTNDCSISIRSQEFGTFIAPSKNLMIDFLTDLFDGKRKHTSDTLTRGIEYAENPSVNLIAATTPKWISDNLSESMVGGGFSSRVVFVYEEHVRTRQLFYDHLDFAKLDETKKKLIDDLTHLTTAITGEFKFVDKACKDKIEEWYRTTADTYEKEDYRLTGYFERKPAHTLKLAMLLHLAYSDDLIIQYTDFEMALKIIEQVEKNMAHTFQAVGKNPYTSEMDAILNYIKAREKVPRKELLARFYHAAPPQTLLELISALISMGEITANGSDPAKDIVYKYVKPNERKESHHPNLTAVELHESQPPEPET